MKFTLIYDGPLPPSPKKRASYAAEIRNKLHVQMRDLWDTHVLMRQLAHVARVYQTPTIMHGGSRLPSVLPDYLELPRSLPSQGMVDLTAPISVSGVTGSFLPIVRNSLYLACGIDILFLRHLEPTHLFEQSGDIDNRLKCFFDALAIPDANQASAGQSACSDPLCVLLENDRLISDFALRSGVLLGKSEKDKYDVRIQADVTVKVLRVFEGNMCLVGG
jgi:hypothetical protein